MRLVTPWTIAMKLCVPIADDRGLESRVHPHLGSAPGLLIVDAEADTARVVANPRCEAARGRCDPLAVLEAEGVGAVVVSSIGPAALERLRAARVAVYHTWRETAADALAAIARGALPPILFEPPASLARDSTDGTDANTHRHP
jgi:predicted Fe-Mo cluster-binding NifX family protein